MARDAGKSSLDKLMELMVTMRMEDEKKRQDDEIKYERDRREREEKAERQKEEQREREERQRREERLLTTLKDVQPAVPQHVTIQTHKLPEMKEGDVEIFVQMFERWKSFFTGEKRKPAKLDPRQAAQKMLRLVGITNTRSGRCAGGVRIYNSCGIEKLDGA